MSTPLRVAAFVTALVAAFAVAWGGGRLVGPIDTQPAAGEMAGHGTDDAHDADAEVDAHGGRSSAVAEATGLTARADGFTLALADREVAPGRTRLEFQVLTTPTHPNPPLRPGDTR